MFEKIRITLREHLPKSQRNARIIKVVLCFTVAVISTAAVYQMQQDQNTLVEVVKPTEHIRAGSLIKATDVKTVEVGGYGLPDGVVKSEDQVIGRYAKTDLFPSDYIIPDKLSRSQEDPFSGSSDGRKIMSFTVSNLAASVAGNIRPGDTIQVIYSETSYDQSGLSGQTSVVMPEVLTRLQVIDIKDAEGYSREESIHNSDGARLYEPTSFIPSVITVYVNDEQAAELYKAEQTKNVYAIFIERAVK
jgi:pilus assembly protein CpaB